MKFLKSGGTTNDQRLLAMNYRSSIDYYLIIDQEDYDTNVAVQMYAPGAATGWYAQEPETN